MAILTTSGRIAMAESIKARAIHLAWGTGSAGWDTTPVAPSISDTALVAEIGRIKAQYVAYCEEDSMGLISVPSGVSGVTHYTESVSPTRSLYCRFVFDTTNAPTATIRETGVFVGATTDPALPSGQIYFVPAEIVLPGTLLLIERAQKFIRSVAVRQSYDIVINF